MKRTYLPFSTVLLVLGGAACGGKFKDPPPVTAAIAPTRRAA